MPESSFDLRSKSAAVLFFLVAAGWAASYLAFGIDLYDEIYILSPGFKLLAEGDHLFTVEIANALRWHDLLNYLLLRPWLPFDVLMIRWAAWAFYALTLVAAGYFAWRRRIDLLAGVTLAFLMLFSAGNLSHTFSYNTWPRNGLLLHHAALWALAGAKDGKRQAAAFLAGLFLALATVAYLPILVVWPFSLAVAWRRRLEFPWTAYLLGLGTLLLWALAAIALAGVPQWSWALTLSSSALLTQGGGSLTRFAQKGFAILGLCKVEIALALLVWFTSRRYPRVLPLILAMAAARGGLRFYQSVEAFSLFIYSVTVVFAVAGAIVTWVRPASSTSDRMVILTSFLAAVTMTGTSSVGFSSFGWALPGLVLIAARAFDGAGTRTLAVLGMGALAVSGAWIGSQRTYYDVTPAEATATLTTPPFRGIRTSPRRAQLLEALSRTFSEPGFVLPEPRLPFLVGYPGVRSSLPTIVGIPVSEEGQNEYLRFLSRTGRAPRWLVRPIQHGHYWGKPDHGSTRLTEMTLPRLERFVECAKGPSVLLEPEIEVYRTDETSVARCIDAP